MKKLFCLGLILFIIGCSNEPGVERVETVIKEVSTNSNASNYQLFNKVVYPISASLTMKDKVYNKLNSLSFGNKAYAGNGNGYVSVGAAKKANDHVAAIFYFDNSSNSDDPIYDHVWHTLDLSSKVGNQTCRVNMYIKVHAAEAGGIDELAQVEFRSPDGILVPKTVIQKYGDVVYYAVELTTNTDGCIQWRYIGNNAFDKKTELGDPEYHDYESLTVYFLLYDSYKVDVASE
jgi:hypothetical protein